MANASAPIGLKLHRANSSPQALITVTIPSSDSKVYGKGDPVKLAGSSAAVGNGPRKATVDRISAGDPIYGVIEGFKQQEAAGSNFNLDRTHRPASIAMYALVRQANYDDEYRVQADDAGTLLDGDAVGLNANLTGNGGGTTITGANTTNGMSTIMLDSSTAADTATLQVKIIDVWDTPSNEVGVANQWFIVRLNNVQGGGGTGSIGA